MDCRIFLVLAALAPTPVAGQCRLCAPVPSQSAAPAPARTLTVEVQTALDFSRAAQVRGGGGTIAIDERSGARAVAGGLVDLGGIALKGTVRVTGEPGRQVRITLPSTILLVAPDGGSAELVDLRTDLGPSPMLDGSGMLSFAFGGRLIVRGGSSGDFRGRIPIVADYQ